MRDRNEIETAKAAARAQALQEARDLAHLYERQGANAGFLRLVLTTRAEKAWAEFDRLAARDAERLEITA